MRIRNLLDCCWNKIRRIIDEDEEEDHSWIDKKHTRISQQDLDKLLQLNCRWKGDCTNAYSADVPMQVQKAKSKQVRTAYVDSTYSVSKPPSFG